MKDRERPRHYHEQSRISKVGSVSSRIAVTGASGLLGSNFVLSAVAHWPITAFYCRHAIALPNAECRFLDLKDRKSVFKELDRVQPSTIVHLASATNVDWCEDHPTETNQLNVDATALLASWAAANGAEMVF